MGRNYAPPLNAKVIRKARVTRFLSQVALAEQVAKIVAVHGIRFDHSSVSLIENGRVKHPNPRVAEALSQVLSIDPEDMFLLGDAGDTAEDDEPEAAVA